MPASFSIYSGSGDIGIEPADVFMVEFIHLEFHQLFFVSGKARTLIIQPGDLSFEFSDRPVPPHAFHFIKRSFKRIVNGSQLCKMTEG